MKPAQIYLLLNGEANGPHDYEDVQIMLREKEITPETLSCIEGMAGWRSVPETMVWSQAKLLELIRPVVEKSISEILSLKLTLPPARVILKKALMSQNILEVDSDSLGIALEANAELNRMHKQYTARENFWNDDDLLMNFPALELTMLGQQKFPRDWLADWRAAGGKTYDGRMIARKDDSIWFKMSDFGFPFPPFSFDTMAWVKSVNQKECKFLGLHDIERVNVFPHVPELKLVGC